MPLKYIRKTLNLWEILLEIEGLVNKYSKGIGRIGKGQVILRYSRSTENGAPSSHIHDGVHSLNSW